MWLRFWLQKSYLIFELLFFFPSLKSYEFQLLLQIYDLILKIIYLKRQLNNQFLVTILIFIYICVIIWLDIFTLLFAHPIFFLIIFGLIRRSRVQNHNIIRSLLLLNVFLRFRGNLLIISIINLIIWLAQRFTEFYIFIFHHKRLIPFLHNLIKIPRIFAFEQWNNIKRILHIFVKFIMDKILKMLKSCCGWKSNISILQNSKIHVRLFKFKKSSVR